jgi:hypothetical protein
MTTTVSPALIALQAGELQRLELPEARAAELAREVEDLNAAVFQAAGELEFDDHAQAPAGEEDRA